MRPAQNVNPSRSMNPPAAPAYSNNSGSVSLRMRGWHATYPSLCIISRTGGIQLGETRTSLFRRTKTSAVTRSSPSLYPPANPLFSSSSTRRTDGWCSFSQYVESSVLPLSMTTTSACSRECSITDGRYVSRWCRPFQFNMTTATLGEVEVVIGD